MGLLDQITGAIDERKRYYGNIVRGLLDNPAAQLEMLRAQNAENVREQARAAQETRSVMPQIAEPAQRAAFDQAMNMGLLGITVYHGSPHKFDKFDSSKIGTGEGAQAYGHGLYLAENPAVANSYKTAGQVAYANSRVQELAMRAFDVSGGDKKKALDWLYKRAKELPKDQSALRQTYYDAMNNYDSVLASGALYKVDLPDDWLPKMLDWDKPLSQQPEAVREIVSDTAKTRAAQDAVKGSRTLQLSDIKRDTQGNPVADQTGGQALSYLMAKRYDGDPAAIAEQLRQAGIPGIRYLDGGSRGAGQGTSNYVVFPGMEQYLKILGIE